MVTPFDCMGKLKFKEAVTVTSGVGRARSEPIISAHCHLTM